MPPKTRGAVRKPRRKDKKNIALGQAHIKSTFNNTIVSITDPTGAVISWASAGEVGMKGSRKSTPFAAQVAAEKAGKAALDYGVKVTGATVHLVDEGVDTGPILAQQVVSVVDDDTADTLHERIKTVERVLLADVVTALVTRGVVIDGRKARIP